MKFFFYFTLFLLSSDILFAQDSIRVLKGFIYTEEGEPLIGQSVIEYGTTNSVLTDMDGSFELNLQEGKPVLIELSFCFSAYYISVNPNDVVINIILDKKTFRKSGKTLRKWKKKFLK